MNRDWPTGAEEVAEEARLGGAWHGRLSSIWAPREKPGGLESKEASQKPATIRGEFL